MKTIKIGKKKINVSHDNFEYFQPNTHTCGDCHIRGVCAATEMTWINVLDELYKKARVMREPVGSTETIDALLSEIGYKWVAIKPKRGESRPTVSGFANNHKNCKYVMRISNHIVGGKNGKYMDIWDCGDKGLYGYWIKES